MNVVDKMARLAMIGHNGTNRKGPGNVPYGGHNRAIVALLKKWGYTEPDDALTLAVAWGLDILGDTDTPESAIFAVDEVLGERILAGIKMLTFKPGVPLGHSNYGCLKAEYIANVARTAPSEIIVVKIADWLYKTIDSLAAGDEERSHACFCCGEPFRSRIGDCKYAAAIMETLHVVETSVYELKRYENFPDLNGFTDNVRGHATSHIEKLYDHIKSELDSFMRSSTAELERDLIDRIDNAKTSEQVREMFASGVLSKMVQHCFDASVIPHVRDLQETSKDVCVEISKKVRETFCERYPAVSLALESRKENDFSRIENVSHVEGVCRCCSAGDLVSDICHVHADSAWSIPGGVAGAICGGGVSSIFGYVVGGLFSGLFSANALARVKNTARARVHQMVQLLHQKMETATLEGVATLKSATYAEIEHEIEECKRSIIDALELKQTQFAKCMCNAKDLLKRFDAEGDKLSQPWTCNQASGRGTKFSNESNGGLIGVAVVAPSEALHEEDVMIQVVGDVADRLSDVVEEAKELDSENKATLRGKLYLENIPLKTTLQFELRMPDLDVDPTVLSHVWSGVPFALQFFVHVGTECRLGPHRSTVLVYADNRPIGHIGFIFNVVSAKKGNAANAPTEPRRYKNYFVSYSNKDFCAVADRIQGIGIVDRDVEGHMFFDILFLRPGERYEPVINDYIDNKADVFLLFWSSNAQASEWVKKEYRRALIRQKENGHPDIIPIPIEVPIPQPPDELMHLHFNDRIMLVKEGVIHMSCPEVNTRFLPGKE